MATLSPDSDEVKRIDAALFKIGGKATWRSRNRGSFMYATLPSLEPDCLVADLDRVMTVEKSIVASWKRTPGYIDDAAGRGFAQSLARKRVRFAFPDDFASLVDKLQRRLADKHDKDSVEARGLRALREIRVRAALSWDAAEVEILFWFVREEEEVLFGGRAGPIS